ncbi:MAG: MFS transporter [Propionibacteriaceae bacterium]
MSLSASRTSSRPRMPHDVWILTANAFFVAVGFGVMIPILPIFAKQFGVSNFLTSWVVSAFALMRLVAAPFAAPISHQLGERWALFLGTMIVAVSSAAAGFSTSFWQLLLFRALGGIGSVIFTVAAMTLLLRSVTPENRGRASGLYNGGFLIGGMAGPAIGGVISAISLTAPFFFYAATLTIGAVMCLTMIRTPATSAVPASTETAPTVSMSQAWSDIRYRAAAVTGFTQGWQSIGVRSALIPVLVTEALAMPREWTGYAMAIAAIVQGLCLAPAGRFTDTIGRRPVMVLGGVLTGLSALAMPWAPNIWWLVVALSVYGVGSAMHSTAPMAAIGDATGGHGGPAVSLYSMIGDIGAIVGPLVAGFLADKAGLPWAFSVGGVMLLMAAGYSLRMPPGIPTKESA